MSGLCRSVVGLATASLLLLSTGCSAPRRHQWSDEELFQRRTEYLEVAAKENAEDIGILIERLKREQDDFDAGRSAEPARLDVLIISGGGDSGAFGAGFLNGWTEVTDPAWKRPVFDVVTGVSAGAIIAPFAFIGDADSCGRICRLYQEPKDDWLRWRGVLFFLPQYPSFMEIDGLQRDIESDVDECVLRSLVAGRHEGRLIAVSATNLDYGMRRVWDLGRESEIALAKHDPRLVTEKLRASSAVPAAFPPVEIDGCLYVDGAVTSNILFNANMRSPENVVRRWRATYPDSPMPLMRFWVILNGQLQQRPQVTQEAWLAVTTTSTFAVVRAATVTALQLLATELALLEALGEARSEFYLVSIPDDWKAPTEELFAKETMRELSILGQRMGADPGSWRVHSIVPAPQPSRLSAAPAPPAK